MGILKPTRPDEPRPPKVLFKNPRYLAANRPELDSKLGRQFTISLAPQAAPPAAGISAFVFCAEPSKPTVWVIDPETRCLGEFAPADAPLVAELIGALHGGLMATIVAIDNEELGIEFDSAAVGETA